MTAFTRAAATLASGAIAWEIKTVNNKGLDIRLRLPPGFDAQEAAFRTMLGSVIARGSVQASLTMQRRAATPQVRVDASLLRELIAAATAVLPPGPTIAPPTMDGLMAVRGVVEIVDAPDTEADRAALADAAHDLLAQAVRDLQVARRSEGAALGTVLADHLDAIAALTQAADDAPGRAPAAQMARLARAVEALAGTAAAIDPARLHQEAILLAARSDVREEIDRLRMHRAAAADLLRTAGAVGRRLDFLAQELAREANTLCAKSSDAGLTAVGLDLRTRIEQFREQVQNLE